MLDTKIRYVPQDFNGKTSRSEGGFRNTAKGFDPELFNIRCVTPFQPLGSLGVSVVCLFLHFRYDVKTIFIWVGSTLIEYLLLVARFSKS